MSNTRRIAYNTVVQVISRALTVGISLVTLGYLTRYLGVEGYGQYNVIFAYLALFGVMVDFGFYLLQVREIVSKPGKESYILGNILGLKLVLSVVVFTLAYLISRVVYDDPVLSMGILFGILSQASISFLHIPNSLFQARLQMQIVAIGNVFARLLYGVAIIWAVKSELPLVQLIGIVSAVNFLTFVAMMLVASRQIRVRPEFDITYWKQFLKEALPLGVSTVLAMLYFRIDTVILGYISGDFAVGIYSAPYKILDVILSLPVIFMSSVFPVMTQAIAQGPGNLQRIFDKAINYSIMAAAPIVAGAFWLSGPIILLLAGPEFELSIPVLRILVWVTAISFLGAVFTYTVIASGRQRILVIPYIVATIFNIVANIILIPKYSYLAAAYITIATEFVVTAWAGVLVYRTLQLSAPDPRWVKSIIAATGMIVVLSESGVTSLFVSIPLAALTYIVLLVALGGVPSGVIKHLIRS